MALYQCSQLEENLIQASQQPSPEVVAKDESSNKL
jgi:hypothetical protein